MELQIPGRSDSINELATALAKAQATIRSAEKNSENEHFKKSYADLAAVWNACREPLASNGLSVVQAVVGHGQNSFLETTLLHSSGQWWASRIPLLLQRQDMQGMGSALTYARRYGLAAMAGVAQEDDDGNDAGRADENKRNSKKQEPQEPKSRPQEKKEAPWSPMEKKEVNAITEAQKAHQWENEAVSLYIKERFGKVFKDLSKEEYTAVLNAIRTMPYDKAMEAVHSMNQPRHEAKGTFDTQPPPELKR